MSLRWLFALVGVLAALAGAALWLAARPASQTVTIEAAPAAIWAASFRDPEGRPRALGEFQGRIVVLNFWATWCGPCRDEMPAFERLHQRWQSRGARFVGLSAESSDASSRFGRELGITYPLWTGGEQVPALSRRLGNEAGGLPHTVLIGRDGAVIEQRVGPYTESELERRLVAITANTR